MLLIHYVNLQWLRKAETSPIFLECVRKKLRIISRAWRRGLEAKVLPLNTPGSHIGANSNFSSCTSHPAPCLWPGKEVEDGPMPWGSAPVWETQKKFLVPSFGLVQHHLLRSLGESIIRQKIFLSVSPPFCSLTL